MNTITFTFKGAEITDPTMDESGRFKVNPVGYYGEPYITAWQDAIVIEPFFDYFQRGFIYPNLHPKSS